MKHTYFFCRCFGWFMLVHIFVPCDLFIRQQSVNWLFWRSWMHSECCFDLMYGSSFFPFLFVWTRRTGSCHLHLLGGCAGVTYVRQSGLLSLSRFIAFLAFVSATMVVNNLHPSKWNLITLVFYTRGLSSVTYIRQGRILLLSFS